MQFTQLARINWQLQNWQEEQKNNITSVEGLKDYLPLTVDEGGNMSKVIDLHPMNIPRYYLSLIDRNDPDDPIRKLCIPQTDELILNGQMGETTQDPYGDDRHDKGNGVLHKYEYTALVVATNYCAMYCRHCFRKKMVGMTNDKTVHNFQKAVQYIASHPEITNVVISGGDPLMLPTKVLRQMLTALQDIDHLSFVRIASRAPVSYPIRFFDDELIDLLAKFNSQKALFISTHFNHPNEISTLAAEAVSRIRNTGITVNNQAVLLKGVNDDERTLVDLMNGLLRIGVSPYYLYQCMPVSRVRHHFQVPLKRGVDLVDKARQQMDGYAKRFKFVIGHNIGKLEICGRIGNKLILKQIHARTGHNKEISRLLVRQLTDTGGWLDDLAEIKTSGQWIQ
ncbi:KamA family protein [Desulfocapsa sulfexigens DSM 10523]|uniref:KamA family protein n=1 Tax=Desulfocapsa sulfexigens (strain DSM 10523 / SB164P1) TaxID=1167006 RepID=M1PCX3_DESSD|nr:KamA family radical SAM protein [Desulfocapsa sulfexigens]AGF77600.1 KamA family protein [Desulfocapsa sulfexigens DSM 10523]